MSPQRTLPCHRPRPLRLLLYLSGKQARFRSSYLQRRRKPNSRPLGSRTVKWRADPALIEKSSNVIHSVKGSAQLARSVPLCCSALQSDEDFLILGKSDARNAERSGPGLDLTQLRKRSRLRDACTMHALCPPHERSIRFLRLCRRLYTGTCCSNDKMLTPGH